MSDEYVPTYPIVALYTVFTIACGISLFNAFFPYVGWITIVWNAYSWVILVMLVILHKNPRDRGYKITKTLMFAPPAFFGCGIWLQALEMHLSHIPISFVIYMIGQPIIVIPSLHWNMLINTYSSCLLEKVKLYLKGRNKVSPMTL